MKNTLLILAALMFFASCGDNTQPEKPQKPDDGAYTGTVSVAPGTADAFTLENIEVKFTLAENETSADIEMMKVKFAVAMPILLDVLISGVSLTDSAEGFSISADGIVPTAMNGRPFEQYTVTDMSGSVTAETISFEMMLGEYPMTFTGRRVIPE